MIARRLVPTAALLLCAATGATACSVTGEPAPLAQEPAFADQGRVRGDFCAQYGVHGDTLAVAVPNDSIGTPGTLTAYELPGRRTLWESPLPATMLSRVYGTHDRFLVSYSPGRDCLTGGPDPLQCPDTQTSAYDAADGTALWRERGCAKAVTADGDIVITSHRSDPSDEDSATVYTGRDADSGAAVWEFEFSLTKDERAFLSTELPVPQTLRGSDPPVGGIPTATWLVITRPNGKPQVIDPATGATSRLAPSGPAERFETFALVGVAGDLALLQESADEVTAYDLSTGQPRWSLPAIDTVGHCGELVCVSRDEGDWESTVHAVDARTGEVRWSQVRSTEPYTGPALPERPDGPLLSSSLWRLRGDPGEPSPEHCARYVRRGRSCFLYDMEPAVLSAKDGSVLLDLTGWTVAGADGSWLVLFQGHVRDEETGDATIAVADLSDLSDPTLHEVGTLDDLRLFGSDVRMPTLDKRGCRVVGDYLACESNTTKDLTIHTVRN